jgi:hypothetical protein
VSAIIIPMRTTALRFCKDCKHFDKGLKECLRIAEQSYDLVTGEVRITNKLSPGDERYNSARCGKDGKYWEPRPEAPLPVSEDDAA